MRPWLAFVPQEFVLLMLMGGALCLIVGARRWASGLFGAAALVMLAPLLVEPAFALMPTWLLMLVGALAAGALLRSLFVLLVGRAATEQMVGTLAADVVRWLLCAPFRLIGWLIGLLLRRLF